MLSGLYWQVSVRLDGPKIFEFDKTQPGLHVLYSLWLPDLYFLVKMVRIMFEFLR